MLQPISTPPSSASLGSQVKKYSAPPVNGSRLYAKFSAAALSCPQAALISAPISLRTVADGYQPQDLLSLIKSGYAPLAPMECWQLENYILSYGIRGKIFLSPFQRGETEECAQAEEIREKLRQHK